MKSTVISLLLIGLVGGLFAQTNNPLQGQDKLVLENERIEDVIESNKPQLKIPFQERTEEELPQLSFESRDVYIESDFVPAPPEPIRLDPPPQPPVYDQFAKIGLGRFLTPLAQLSLHGNPQNRFTYGFDYRHLSAWADQLEYREFNLNEAKFAFSAPYDEKRLVGKVEFFNNGYFNYGDTAISARNTLEQYEQEIRQRVTQFALEGHYQTIFNPEDPMAYDLGLRLLYHGDRRSNYEFHVSALPEVSYALGEDLSLNATADLTPSWARIDTQQQVRLFFDIAPTLTYNVERFSIEAGGRLNFFTNSADSNTYFNLAPLLEARFRALPQELTVFAGVTGGMTNNRYADHIRINPFLDDSVQIVPSIEKYNVFLGASGRISNRLDYDARGFYRRVENALLYYLPNPEEAYFQLGYDSLLTDIGVDLSVNYDLLDNLRAGARMRVHNYNTTTFAELFHATPFLVNVYGQYRWREQFTFRTQLNYFGSTPMVQATDGEIINRSTFVDLNLGADYRITDRFSAWAEINNLLSINYERWYNYLERPIDFKVGLSYAF